MGISRRSFLVGGSALLGGAALSAFGCSPTQKTQQESDQAMASTQGAPGSSAGQYVVEDFEADETKDADIVIMGIGMSGTAALLEAVQSGLKVIGLEAADSVGGNGALTGMQGGVDSQMAKDAGIHVDTCDIVHDEMKFFNYRIDALYWLDCIATSGENIDWMVENGAQFAGTVDDSFGRGRVKTSHSYKDDLGGSAIFPMVDTAKSLGAEVLLGTRGVKLIMKDGAVSGIVAEQGKKTLRINTPAVVFASGGYGANYDLMIKKGCPPVFYSKSVETSLGDALLMAEAAGGQNITANSAMLFSVTIPTISYVEARDLNRVGQLLLVNGNGERFTDESCFESGFGCYLNTLSTQPVNYLILTKNIADYVDTVLEGVGTKIVERCSGAEFDLDPSIGTLFGEELPEEFSFSSDTVEGLAEKLNMDPEILKSTVDRYNEFCRGGKDLDFGKDPETLMELDGSDGYYAMRIYPGYATSIGGIKTNRDYCVVDALNEPITGLYAIGCDGSMMYKETYTIEVPGSCNMMNVHSGRAAVRHAIANAI